MNCLQVLRSISGLSAYKFGIKTDLGFLRNISTGILRKSSDEGEEKTEEAPAKKVDPAKDRSKVIPVETSMKYLESDAYYETYENDFVWKLYRRNHKFQRPRVLTRRTCIANNVITVGSPCPICRDEYLVLDYRNLKLIKQFIAPHTNEVIDAYHTGLCQKKHFELLVAVERARDYGILPYYIPQRIYNYDDYYSNKHNHQH